MPPKTLLIAAAAILVIHSAHGATLIDAWRAARDYDAHYLAACEALSAGLEKSTQGDALLLPKVGLSANAGRAESSDHYTKPGKADANAHGPQYGATLTLTQPLYDAAAYYGRDQLKVQTTQAQAQFRVAEQDLILRVAKACFDLSLARENLALVRAQKDAVGQQLAQARKAYAVGAANITDTHDAQARFDAMTATELSAQNDLDVKRAAYRQLTDLDPDQLQSLTEGALDAPDSPQPDDLSAWLGRARQDSLDVIAQQLGLKVARLDVKRYSLEGSPVLSLVASHDQQWDGASPSYPGFMYHSTQNMIGLQLTVPLLDGGYRRSKEREAVALAAQQQDVLEATVRDAMQTTRQSFLGAKTGAAQIRALEQAVKSSASSLASTRLSHDLGLRTMIDVLNAQQQHFQNAYNLVFAQYQYLLSMLQLNASVGDLSEADLQRVNAWFVASVPAAN
jgi:outer membrane protein